jgi:hypothetical protein
MPGIKLLQAIIFTTLLTPLNDYDLPVQLNQWGGYDFPGIKYHQTGTMGII